MFPTVESRKYNNLKISQRRPFLKKKKNSQKIIKIVHKQASGNHPEGTACLHQPICYII